MLLTVDFAVEGLLGSLSLGFVEWGVDSSLGSLA